MGIEITKTAPGKVNLFFAVGDVQPNGYHPVASLYAAVSLYERVTVAETSVAGISQSVSIAADSPLQKLEQQGLFDVSSVPLDERNLAFQAAEIVLQAQGIAVNDVAFNIHMDKAVPVAGGMGGGSADAAAALLAVNEYLKARGIAPESLSFERLLELAASLGADVPFALRGGLAVGLGVGDQLTPVELPPQTESLHLVLVLAPFGLSTPAVFAELDRGRAAGEYPPAVTASDLEVPRRLIEALQSTGDSAGRVNEIAPLLHNDLAAPALALAPDLRKTLDLNNEAIAGSFVSGSGPTIAFLMNAGESAADFFVHQLETQGLSAVSVQICL